MSIYVGYYKTTDLGKDAIDWYIEDQKHISKVLHIGEKTIVLINGDRNEELDNIGHILGVEKIGREQH